VIRVELRKQAFRMRTYIALGLMIGVPILITLAVEFGRRPHNREQQSFFALATHSGLNVPLAALSATTTFLLVIVVALFAGGAISEESNWGSLRYLLLRPISRNRLLVSKLIVACILAFIATILIPITGLVVGTVFFGWHPVVTPGLRIFSQTDALARISLATLYVAWCMTGVMALAFMISTMTDASLGAVSGAVGLTIISEILNAIDTLGSVRHWLITHYWHAWEGLFANPPTTSDMVNGALLQIPYVVVFLAFGWWWFHRRDILS
jgi:ABC-2 type transport system permease protein